MAELDWLKRDLESMRESMAMSLNRIEDKIDRQNSRIGQNERDISTIRSLAAGVSALVSLIVMAIAQGVRAWWR